jgi:hypothetical protein
MRDHERAATGFRGAGDEPCQNDSLTRAGGRYEQNAAFAGRNLGLNAGDDLALIGPQ